MVLINLAVILRAEPQSLLSTLGVTDNLSSENTIPHASLRGMAQIIAMDFTPPRFR